MSNCSSPCRDNGLLKGSNTLQAHQLVALAGRQGQGTEAVGALYKHSDEGRASISDSRVLVDVGGSSACRMWRPCWRLMSFMRRCRTATGGTLPLALRPFFSNYVLPLCQCRETAMTPIACFAGWHAGTGGRKSRSGVCHSMWSSSRGF